MPRLGARGEQSWCSPAAASADPCPSAAAPAETILGCRRKAVPEGALLPAPLPARTPNCSPHPPQKKEILNKRRRRAPAAARGAGVDFEVSPSSLQVPTSPRGSTPLTFQSKPATSSLAQILLPPLMPTPAAAASSPEPPALRTQQRLQDVLGTH